MDDKRFGRIGLALWHATWESEILVWGLNIFHDICLLCGMLRLSGESSEQEDLLTGFEQWAKVLEAIQNR